MKPPIRLLTLCAAGLSLPACSLLGSSFRPQDTPTVAGTFSDPQPSASQSAENRFAPPSTQGPTSYPSYEPTQEPSVAPTYEPTQKPTAAPTYEPTQEPTAAPTYEPTQEPTAAPTYEPTQEPTPTPSVASQGGGGGGGSIPVPTPTVSATDDISIVERTTFNGDIKDDFAAPLDGVTVRAKSLNSSVPFEATAYSSGGKYTFNNAPAGVQLEIVASRPGYTTRVRIVVLKSNKQGDPNANKYDFTGNIYAMSDKPEVVAITPSRNSSGVSASTSFVMSFSEPMDKNSVEDNFVVRAYTTESLSVDGNASNNFTVKHANITLSDTTGTKIWDKSDFQISWNSDETEATFTFRDEKHLPTDTSPENVPDYQITLNNGDSQIKDKSGISRYTAGAGEGAFKLVVNGEFEQSSKFSIQTDNTQPTVSRITAQTAENGGQDGDSIRVVFSKPMIYYTQSVNIAGGMDGSPSSKAAASIDSVSASQAAANYSITVRRGGSIIVGMDNVSWASLEGGGGAAVFDTMDATHKTVKLLPPQGADLYKPGDNITIQIETSVLDPAGNSIDPTDNDASASAN